MYLKNTWYAALWSQDLKPGELIHRRFLDAPVLMFRNEDGEPSAILDVCPHRGAPLHLGQLKPGGKVRCAYHGLEFDGMGQCVHNPHSAGEVPRAMKTASFTLHEKHTMLWIWMGEEPANPALIPDFSLMDDGAKGIVHARSYLTIAANYMLIVENLLDLSHANYLHEGILGFPEHSAAAVKVEQDGTSVICHRKMGNVPVAKLHDLLFRRDGQKVDMWNKITWDVPACLKLLHGFSQPGASEKEAFEFTAVHFLTPETEGTTHYYYGIARAPAKVDEDDVKEVVAETRKYVFENQDRVILEAQQKNLSEMKKFAPVLLHIDGASIRMRRIMSRLMADEAARRGNERDVPKVGIV